MRNKPLETLFSSREIIKRICETTMNVGSIMAASNHVENHMGVFCVSLCSSYRYLFQAQSIGFILRLQCATWQFRYFNNYAHIIWQSLEQWDRCVHIVVFILWISRWKSIINY